MIIVPRSRTSRRLAGRAGTLTVTLTGEGSARVAYDLTALSPAGAADIAHVRDHLQEMLDSWSAEIASAVRRRNERAPGEG